MQRLRRIKVSPRPKHLDQGASFYRKHSTLRPKTTLSRYSPTDAINDLQGQSRQHLVSTRPQ